MGDQATEEEPSVDEGALEETQERTQVDLDCPNCGARLFWNPEADALTCDHCGHAGEVPRREGEIVERPLDGGDDVPRGFGYEARVVRCQNCGARVTFEGSETATACVFCGSPRVLAQDANRNAVRPESLIPLDVSRTDVEAKFANWLRSLWFRPSALRRQAETTEAIGVYVPAWTFDCDVDSSWSADAGYYYYVKQRYSVMVGGRRVMRTRRVRKVRWKPTWGERQDRYDDLQVIASHGVRGDLANELGIFDTRELVPYRPEYLAGWRAEEYQVDLADAWTEGQARVRERQRARCAGDVPGDTYRRLRVDNDIRDVHWKHVLLPMWSVTYEYGGKPYAVLIHGQSGRVAGDAPLSWWKILGMVALVAAVAGVIVLVAAI